MAHALNAQIYKKLLGVDAINVDIIIILLDMNVLAALMMDMHLFKILINAFQIRHHLIKICMVALELILIKKKIYINVLFVNLNLFQY
jgi:hypothetical protein